MLHFIAKDLGESGYGWAIVDWKTLMQWISVWS